MREPILDLAAGNAPEWTVTELSLALKRTIEEAYGYVRVRGEISGYRGPHSSGHAYFVLKDEGARIEAVIWKSAFSRLKTLPQEGLEVIAHGRLTTFSGKSAYQIVIERLEPAGVGALMALLEDRRRRLAAEGLFDEVRKQPLPFLPRVVGVVTSPTGAVIRDILHRLSDRFPRRVLVWPVRVQGETSAAEIAAAIRGFDALAVGGPLPRPDVLIVARGGGSFEDLLAFSEEVVVRAAAACSIPLISAVGHETDWTLIDHVADRRAPTPTGAAEMAVPVRSELMVGLRDHQLRLESAALRLIERRRTELRHLSRGLPVPDALLASPRQRLDVVAGRLIQSLLFGVRRHQQTYDALCRRLVSRSPAAALQRSRDRLHSFAERLDACALASVRRRRDRFGPISHRLSASLVARRLQAEGARLAALSARFGASALSRTATARGELGRLAGLLEAFSYQSVLRRGFALVRDLADQPIRDSARAAAAGEMDIQFADGRVRVAIPGTGRAARGRVARQPQGDLFRA